MAKRQDFLKMFGRKRRGKGMLWASLIGLGVSAAAFGLGKNRQNKTTDTVQSLMTDFKLPNLNIGQMPKMATLTEFAKELVPNNNQNLKNHQQTNNNQSQYKNNQNSNPNSKL